MADEVLNSLLKELEQKKLQAEMDLVKRKEEVERKIPKLQQIEQELNQFAILTAKNLLLHHSSSLQELEHKAEDLKIQRASLLEEAGFPADYLTPHYDCMLCQDTGYVLEGNHKTKMCSCLKQKLLDYSFHKSNMTNLETENFDTFNEKLFSDEIDLAKYHFPISPRTNMINIKKKCLEFVEHFDSPSSKNLLFSGNTGLR